MLKGRRRAEGIVKGSCMGRVVVLILAMGVVAYMSLKSQYPGIVRGFFDVVGSVFLHLIAYLGLTLLFFWSLRRRRLSGFFLAFLLSFLYGFLLEVAQIWVPGRSFSGGDLLVNFLGAVMGVAVLKYEGVRRENVGRKG